MPTGDLLSDNGISVKPASGAFTTSRTARPQTPFSGIPFAPPSSRHLRGITDAVCGQTFHGVPEEQIIGGRRIRSAVANGRTLLGTAGGATEREDSSTPKGNLPITPKSRFHEAVIDVPRPLHTFRFEPVAAKLSTSGTRSPVPGLADDMPSISAPSHLTNFAAAVPVPQPKVKDIECAALALAHPAVIFALQSGLVCDVEFALSGTPAHESSEQHLSEREQARSDPLRNAAAKITSSEVTSIEWQPACQPSGVDLGSVTPSTGAIFAMARDASGRSDPPSMTRRSDARAPAAASVANALLSFPAPLTPHGKLSSMPMLAVIPPLVATPSAEPAPTMVASEARCCRARFDAIVHLHHCHVPL